jgi:hypothetical protein
MNSIEATAAVVDALDACGIDYMVVGAFSSNAYSIGRSTKDADFVVALQPGHLTMLMQRLGAEFHLDRQLQLETLTGSKRNVVTYLPTKFQIELFRLNAQDEHHAVRFRRRVRRMLNEIKREVWIPTVEDVVIQKLRWQRRKDLDDVVNVLTVSGPMIDWTYLRSWTAKHGTDALLEELLQEVPDLTGLDETV